MILLETVTLPKEKKFNANMAVAIFVITTAILAKLIQTASATGNWKGAWITTAHVLVVAIGSYMALRHTCHQDGHCDKP